MSSPILPVQGPSGPTIDNPSEAAHGASEADRVEDRVGVPLADGGVSADRVNRVALGAHASTAIGDVGAFIDQLAAGVSALTIASSPEGEASPSGPPPEVLDQIAAAGKIGEQLREVGHELRFFAPTDGGRVRIEIHDRDGNVLGTVSPAAALELAAGSPLN
jgi:hypothetical protein